MYELNFLGRLQSRALRVLLLAFAASLSVLAEPTLSGAKKPDFSKARKTILEQMDREPIPSITVGVARKGEILWEEGFGWADRENRISANKDTMYYTASITKNFTATALMILYERKKLDLDRPVNEYLVGAKLSSPTWNPAEATVRRVATHTAGLTTFNVTQSLSNDETIRRYGVLFWPPGEQFDYSNLGPIILEEVIARVSGQSYAEFMRSEVFRPLGITRASVGFEPGLEKQTARCYGGDPQVVIPRPPGGIYCSAHDLLRFGMFHLTTRLADQKAILSETSIDAMQNETVEAGGSRSRYGLSWWVEENRFGFRSVLGQGGMFVAQAWLRLIPSEGIAVVLLANSGHESVSTVVDEILSALLPSYAENRARPVAVTESSKPAQVPLRPFVGSWKGIVKTFRGDIPLAFSIPDSGEVRVRVGTQPATILDKPRFNEKRLAGTVTAGKLGFEEETGPYHGADMLEFYLYLRDGALKGAVVTRHASPYWVELKRESQRAGQSP